MDALMLTCGTGGGHNTACAAVAEAMAARGHAVTTLNPYTLKNDQVAEVIDKAYILLAQKAPNAFGAAYKLGDAYRKLPFPSPVYRINRLMEPLLEKYIEGNHFDAVVTTHLFPGEMLTSMKRRGANVPRTYFIATDYACIPFTEETDLDRYIIPAKELTAEFIGRGIDPERIRPLGIPVRRQFYGQEDRSAIRGRLGLDLGKKMILVAGGSIGAGHIQRVVELLLDRYESSAEIVVICGSNRELEEDMRSAFGERCAVLGFTDQMADYMKACDLYLSKPGGLSSTEAAVVGTALVHITPIPGCETSNMHFFAQNGMSLAVNSPEHELTDACDRLLEAGAREKMIECQHRVIPGDAATAIHNHFLLYDTDVKQSMGRKGNCLDNVVMENFFRLLKSELLYLQDFDSLERFKTELIDYLDYYNNRRIKAKSKGLTPAQRRYQTLQVA